MTALRAACEKLVEAIDRREKHGHELIERRRDEPVSLDAMREWPEHREWQRAIADEKYAQNAIRAALAEETAQTAEFVRPQATNAPKVTAFKVGDRVRVVKSVKTSAAFVGKSGTVVRLESGLYPVRVYLDGFGESIFDPSELSPDEVRT